MPMTVAPDQEIQQTETLVGRRCPSCSVIFAIPKFLFDLAHGLEHGRKAYYCPNGHRLVAIGQSPEQIALNH